MGRTLRFGLVGIAASAALMLPSMGAWAGSPHFSGSAPGSATCKFSLSLRFSPALTNSGGGTTSRVVGKGRSCVASYPGITFKRTQAVQVNGGLPFATNPGLCGATTSPGGSFSVRWKGNFNGTYLGVTWSGPASFTSSDISTGGATIDTSSGFVGLDLLPPSSGSNVSGSFNPTPPGGFGSITGSLQSTTTPAKLASLCAGKGVKVLKVSGLLTIS